MKRLMIMVLVMGLTAGAASAQSAGNKSSRTTRMSSTGTYKAKMPRKDKKEIKAPSAVLNNRKIYHWQNGQRSTPTGREAAPTGGSYQSLKRSSAATLQEDND